MSESTVVQCPSCQARLAVMSDQVGQTVACPTCGKPFVAMSGPPAAVGYNDGPGAGGRGEPLPTSGIAIASLVCGIPFCFFPLNVAALVLGIIGINKTGPGKARGRGAAIAGTVLGGVGLAMTPVLLLLISILLPSLNKARETANRAKCASEMHQIGLAILLYQQDNRQAYPPDLVTLAKNEQLSLSTFVCPSSNDTPAAAPDQLTAGGHLSYVYLRPNTTNPDAMTPILYENASDHAGNGTNILFGDGHVAWYTAAAAKGILPPSAP